jgi:DNA (cytosine-5)-methyltransferase 1
MSRAWNSPGSDSASPNGSSVSYPLTKTPPTDSPLIGQKRPGEKLPKFPAPTHGEPGSGLKPYVKIKDAINNIPQEATHQDMISDSRNPDTLTPFSEDSFAKCITTSGGQYNHHPSGERKYSVREMACLQGFPTNHAFSESGIGQAMRQVGNAVPPTLAKAWFEKVIESLRETDNGMM